MYVKSFLKLVLADSQIVFMGRIHHKFKSFCVLVFFKVFNSLPYRFLVFIKSGINITKKLDFDKSDIYLSIESDIEYTTRLSSCAKEPEMVYWFETFFKEGDIFYDIGANIGAYSLVASKLFNGKIKVYAFEPGFSNFGQLGKNIFINNSQESVIPLQIALSDRTGIDIFNYSNLTPGGALHALGEPKTYTGETFEPVFKQSIISFQLDDFIKLFNIPVPNHVKIDVDGIEFKILKGAQHVLREPTFKSLMVEIDEANPQTQSMVNYLKDRGFSVDSKHKYVGGGQTGAASKLYNYLFSKDEVL
jgi:FkbM family methyltransferase